MSQGNFIRWEGYEIEYIIVWLAHPTELEKKYELQTECTQIGIETSKEDLWSYQEGCFHHQTALAARNEIKLLGLMSFSLLCF